MRVPLRVLIVEDEALLLMQLETFLEDEGHVVAGTALSSHEAVETAAGVEADIALVDLHLGDGPTGIDVCRFITERTRMAVVFTTANPGRIPEDFSGAIGVIAKPYTQAGINSALDYVRVAMRHPPPTQIVPRSLLLAPKYARQWDASTPSP